MYAGLPLSIDSGNLLRSRLLSPEQVAHRRLAGPYVLVQHLRPRNRDQAQPRSCCSSTHCCKAHNRIKSDCTTLHMLGNELRRNYESNTY